MEPRNNQMNLQGLLKFALNCSQVEDSTNSLDFQNMDEERRDFLKSALANMTVDVMEEFHKAISVLENSESTVLDIINALNVIRDYIDNIDFANNFVKVGGTNVLLKYVKSKNPQISSIVMYIISEMSQNNPFCQEHFLNSEVIPILSENLKSGSDDVGAAALHAISALVRNFHPGLLAFLRIGGIQSMLDSTNTVHSRKFIKACFLIANLSIQSTEVRDKFISESAIEKLSQFLEVVSGFDVKIENLLFALSVLAKSEKWQPDDKLRYDLKQQLNELITVNKELAQCEEMIEYANNIIKCLNGDQ